MLFCRPHPVTAIPLRFDVQLGRLLLANPIMVASGTFGYAREMAAVVPLGRLGAILPKTITLHPRPGNPPPRTVETAAGMLNSIGLDNDGIQGFLDNHWPYLASLGTAVIVSIAGKSHAEFVELAQRLNGVPGIAALELNVSCPNVSGGVDFGTSPTICRQVVAGVRQACSLPILVKLTPNVTDVTVIARAAEDGGADALSLINTCLGMAVELAQAASAAGKRPGRVEWTGHQAHRAEDRLPGTQGGEDSTGGDRRHRHDRRLHGLPRGRG